MQLLYLVYAALLLLGGVMGYTRARSLPSLIASTFSAMLVIIGVSLLHQYRDLALGLEILVSLALGIVFIRRYQATKKPMPAIPILVLSALVLIGSIGMLMTKHSN